MTAFERFRRQDSTVALFFAIAVLVVIQTILSISVIISPAIKIPSGTAPTVPNTPQYAIILFPTNPIIAVVYFILPVILCSIISAYFFCPKRVVSPIYVSIGTIVVVTILIISRIPNLAIQLTSTQWLGLLLIGFLFFGGMILFAGFIQTMVVRWLVGLNLNKLDQCSYSINGDFQEIPEILRSGFYRFWHLSPKYKSKKCQVYQTNYRDGRNVVLAIGSHPKYKHKTILSMVAFQISYYGLESSDWASYTRDKIFRDLIGTLKEKKSRLSFKRLSQETDRVSRLAYSTAILPTISQMENIREFFRNLSRYFQTAIVITVIAFLAITAGWWFKVGGFDTNAYIDSLILLLVMLVAELGYPLATDLARKSEEKKKQLEDSEEP